MESVNLVSLSYKETFRHLRSALISLENIANITDFANPNQRELFSKYIVYIKSYFERLEVLTRTELSMGGNDDE